MFKNEVIVRQDYICKKTFQLQQDNPPKNYRHLQNYVINITIKLFDKLGWNPPI